MIVKDFDFVVFGQQISCPNTVIMDGPRRRRDNPDRTGTCGLVRRQDL
jgi:hypothetical protein